jgi:hypothetical protein
MSHIQVDDIDDAMASVERGPPPLPSFQDRA